MASRASNPHHWPPDDLEDVGLAVRGAALGRQPEWLPAVEQFGEGFFIRFAPEALERWLARPEVGERARRLRDGADAWRRAKEARGTDGAALP